MVRHNSSTPITAIMKSVAPLKDISRCKSTTSHNNIYMGPFSAGCNDIYSLGKLRLLKWDCVVIMTVFGYLIQSKEQCWDCTEIGGGPD